VPDTAQSIRANARDAMRAAIVAAALEQLAEVGADALSLRGVARQVGMASSAIYRHVPNRDALLTLLIIEGYDALGTAVEEREATCVRSDRVGRFRATCHAARTWAQANPHHWALLYGSPVPGYAAPEETVGPAIRVSAVMAGILRDGKAATSTAGVDPEGIIDPAVLTTLLMGVDPSTARAGVLAWVTVYGVISFELFGHLIGSVVDVDGFFEATLATLADGLALSDPATND